MWDLSPITIEQPLPDGCNNIHRCHNGFIIADIFITGGGVSTCDSAQQHYCQKHIMFSTLSFLLAATAPCSQTCFGPRLVGNKYAPIFMFLLDILH